MEPDEARSLIEAASRGKHQAAVLYRNLAKQMAPGALSAALSDLATEETEHAHLLHQLLANTSAQPLPKVGMAVPLDVPEASCRVDAEPWGLQLMAAFALDQAITAALLALNEASDAATRSTTTTIIGDEQRHQTLVIQTFAHLASQDAAHGRVLAAGMIDARDWVKATFPRRATLVRLVEQGSLPSTAASRHDAFLASLGDRIQEALGVLGD